MKRLNHFFVSTIFALCAALFASSAPAQTGQWTFCANGNEFCSFSGTKLVRYGAGTTFATQTATNGISCANWVFGDPIPGVAKHCDYSDLPATTLTVGSTNPGSGAAVTVSPNDNNAQGNGSTQFTRVYNNSTAVTLVAAATAGGNNFSSWTGCDVITGFTCNVTMNVDKTVTAAYGGQWSFCANGNEFCSFSGTKLVRYGAGTTFATQTATNGISCANWVFGDPIPGVVKHCDYSDPVVTGTISGVVSQSGSGAAISGALVEALQGGALKGSATTAANGSYSVSNLAVGSYDIRASSAGYGTQTQSGQSVTAGSTTTVNFSLVSVPNITGVSPSSGPTGTAVTINGTGFGATQGANTITFNGTGAAPSSWTDTSIVAPVPNGATTGPVVVTVAGVVSNGVTFTVTGGGGTNPTKLVVTSVNSGSNPTAGVGFSVVIQAQDNGGTPRNVTADTAIALSLKTGTGTLGGSLTGTIPAGTNQVTISGVTYTKAESGIVLTATRTSGDSLTAGDSAPFTVVPGAATKVAFSTQPGNSTAGSPLSGPPTVVVQDSLGNTVTSSTASITIGIGTNPGGGALSGTTTKNAVSGVASFTELIINQGANGYTLAATSAGLTTANSASFNIIASTGTISGVVSQSGSGTAISGALVEALQGGVLRGSATTAANGSYSISNLAVGSYDIRASSAGYGIQTQNGQSVTAGSTTTINFSLGLAPNITGVSPSSGPTGTVVIINGSNFGVRQGSNIITFNGTGATPTSWSDTSIAAPVPNGATTGPVVVTVAGVVSNGVTFTVTGGGGTNPTKLVVTSVNSGSNPTAGVGFSVAIQAQDNGGTPRNVNAGTAIALSLKTGTGTLGGSLTGTIAAGTNQVTITGVTYTKAESGVVITATRTSGDSLTAGDSAAFTVVPGAATKVAFSTQPGNSTAGSPLSGPPTVVVQDSLGNTVTSSTALITVAIGTNPGGGTLSGTTPKNASGGVASFSDLSINKAGNGYTLTASATGLTGATSSAFNISAGAASQVAFTTQPGSATAGTAIPGPTTATVQDSFGNTVTSSTASITLAIGNNPGGGTLSGTTTKNAAAGVASFSDLSINKAGNSYTLTASVTGLTSATSSAFNITAAAANKVVFTTQPTSATAGSALGGPPTITVQDGLGNTVTSSTAAITMAIGTNPSGGTLSGTTTKNASSGVVSFNDLSINLAGNGYTLIASATGLTGATSSTFNITASAGVSLTVTPTSIPGGDLVTVTWAQIPSPTNIDWIGLFPPGGSNPFSLIDWLYVGCTQTPTVPVASGSCPFAIPGTVTPGTYEFRLFNDTFDVLATSNPITVGPPLPPSKLALSLNNNFPMAGSSGTYLRVESHTPAGTLSGVITNTTVTISVKTGTGFLSGPVSGTFTVGQSQIGIGPINYSKAESGVVFTATVTSGDSLAPADSPPLTINPGPAAALAFITQPGNSQAGVVLPGPPKVAVTDDAGNMVPSSTANITVKVANPVYGVLYGTTSKNATASIAEFNDLTINEVYSGYTLAASSPNLTGATSNPFNVTISTGGLVGAVSRADTGVPISGALIEAFDSSGVLKGSATTDSSGNYSIAALATGILELRVSAGGYVAQPKSGVAVTLGSITTANFSLAAQRVVYVYDALSRLKAVVDVAGQTATYGYDAVGNLLGINRYNSSQVSVIEFAPSRGPVGATVTIFGTGFSETPSQNTVTFNGVLASVVSVAPTQIVTMVPVGATTGPIGVTAPAGSATSSASFTVTSAASSGIPAITSFTPTIGLSGTAVTVNGSNFDPTPIKNELRFGVARGAIASSSATSISTTVPTGASSGRISVTTTQGKGLSTSDFYVPPPTYTPADIEFTSRISTDGTPLNVNISASNKNGLLLFDGIAGDRVLLSVLNPTYVGGWNVAVYRPDGSYWDRPSTSSDYYEPAPLPASGTYTILVSPGGAGQATFKLFKISGEDRGTITPGVPTLAIVSIPGQNPHWTFAGTAGQRISLDVTNSNLPAGCFICHAAAISILKPDGQILTGHPFDGSGTLLDLQILPLSGTYTIILDPSQASIGHATITLYNVPPDNQGTITVLGTPVTVITTIPGQRASLTFTGTAGQQVSVGSTNVTMANSLVQLYDSTSTLLASGSQVNINNSRYVISKLLPSDGTYSVLVDPTSSNIGSMTLRLDVINLTETPASIPRGSSVTATWSGRAIARTDDFLRLFLAGTQTDYATQGIPGTSSGSLPFTIPSSVPPGTYELRLFSNSCCTGVATVAISNTFTVTGP